MLASARQRALKLLVTRRPEDPLACRDVEAACHARAHTPSEYADHVMRAAFHLEQSPTIGVELVDASDDELARGTLAGRIEHERRAREERFQQMLQEKYDELNEARFQALVRCRRCGSEDVTWQEKQTRSADEATTVFVVCTTCKNVWVLR